MKATKILLVEDNPADVRLIQEAFKKFKIINKLMVVYDGEEATDYLKLNIPDIVILDLNIPKKNGLEVLKEMKEDIRLKHIPVIILTTSESNTDILSSYQNYASCYITKPISMNEFIKTIEKFKIFWLSLVKLPNV